MSSRRKTVRYGDIIHTVHGAYKVKGMSSEEDEDASHLTIFAKRDKEVVIVKMDWQLLPRYVEWIVMNKQTGNWYGCDGDKPTEDGRGGWNKNYHHAWHRIPTTVAPNVPMDFDYRNSVTRVPE